MEAKGLLRALSSEVVGTKNNHSAKGGVIEKESTIGFAQRR